MFQSVIVHDHRRLFTLRVGVVGRLCFNQLLFTVIVSCLPFVLLSSARYVLIGDCSRLS